ncbi:MAG: cytochrome c5 family protein [Rhodocyclales bacterium]|nr:cytochrome c5 family protein [Rhodocyclales bacterium]
MAHSNLRAFAIASAVLVSTSTVVVAAPKGDEEGTAKRIAPVARVELAPASTGPAAGNRSGEQIYKSICAACHDSGAANAPKLGDKAAWAPRIKLGLDGLVKSAIAGKNAMPPKGGSDANDVELARTIVYLANKSGASFKEPAAK